MLKIFLGFILGIFMGTLIFSLSDPKVLIGLFIGASLPQPEYGKAVDIVTKSALNPMIKVANIVALLLAPFL